MFSRILHLELILLPETHGLLETSLQFFRERALQLGGASEGDLAQLFPFPQGKPSQAWGGPMMTLGPHSKLAAEPGLNTLPTSLHLPAWAQGPSTLLDGERSCLLRLHLTSWFEERIGEKMPEKIGIDGEERTQVPRPPGLTWPGKVESEEGR